MKEQDLPYGSKIIGFSSLEEMMGYQAAREAELMLEMEHLSDAQRQVTYHSYAINLVPDHDGSLALVVFGRVASREEFEILELGAGANPMNGEIEMIMRRYDELYAKGYRYGRWFSEPYPDGEFGDTHITQLWPITEADYQHALNNRWACPAYLLTRVRDEMREAGKDNDE